MSLKFSSHPIWTAEQTRTFNPSTSATPYLVTQPGDTNWSSSFNRNDETSGRIGDNSHGTLKTNLTQTHSYSTSSLNSMDDNAHFQVSPPLTSLDDNAPLQVVLPPVKPERLSSSTMSLSHNVPITVLTSADNSDMSSGSQSLPRRSTEERASNSMSSLNSDTAAPPVVTIPNESTTLPKQRIRTTSERSSTVNSANETPMSNTEFDAKPPVFYTLPRKKKSQVTVEIPIEHLRQRSNSMLNIPVIHELPSDGARFRTNLPCPPVRKVSDFDFDSFFNTIHRRVSDSDSLFNRRMSLSDNAFDSFPRHMPLADNVFDSLPRSRYSSTSDISYTTREVPIERVTSTNEIYRCESSPSLIESKSEVRYIPSPVNTVRRVSSSGTDRKVTTSTETVTRRESSSSGPDVRYIPSHLPSRKVTTSTVTRGGYETEPEIREVRYIPSPSRKVTTVTRQFSEPEIRYIHSPSKKIIKTTETFTRRQSQPQVVRITQTPVRKTTSTETYRYATSPSRGYETEPEMRYITSPGNKVRTYIQSSTRRQSGPQPEVRFITKSPRNNSQVTTSRETITRRQSSGPEVRVIPSPDNKMTTTRETITRRQSSVPDVSYTMSTTPLKKITTETRYVPTRQVSATNVSHSLPPLSTVRRVSSSGSDKKVTTSTETVTRRESSSSGPEVRYVPSPSPSQKVTTEMVTRRDSSSSGPEVVDVRYVPSPSPSRKITTSKETIIKETTNTPVSNMYHTLPKVRHVSGPDTQHHVTVVKATQYSPNTYHTLPTVRRVSNSDTEHSVTTVTKETRKTSSSSQPTFTVVTPDSQRSSDHVTRLTSSTTVRPVYGMPDITISKPLFTEGTTPFDMTASVKSPSGITELCDVVSLDDSHYSIKFVPQEMGVHTVSVKHKDMHIPGSPFEFTVGPIAGGGSHKVHAAGPGLERGEVNVPAEFNIYTREAGAGGLSIAVEGPSKAEIDFQDKKDGSCQVSYQVNEPGYFLFHSPGEYYVSVKFNDEHIPDSPFRVNVSPSIGDARKCSVQALQDKGLQANKPAAFVVNFNGAKGRLTARVVSPSGSEEEALVQEIDDVSYVGQYAVRFIPRENGVHMVHVLFDNYHIPESPFKICVGKIDADAGKVTATGDGLRMGRTVETAKFMVNTMGAGSGSLAVTVEGPSKVKLECQEVDEGYEFSYKPTAPGDYFICIKYAGVNIAGSPFKAKIEGQGQASAMQEHASVVVETVTKTSTTTRFSGIQRFTSDATKVTASGKGLTKAFRGQTASFTVDASQAGNNIMYIGMMGPKGPCDELVVKHQGNLNYTVQYKVKESGRYMLIVRWGDQDIPGSPFAVEVQ